MIIILFYIFNQYKGYRIKNITNKFNEEDEEESNNKKSMIDYSKSLISKKKLIPLRAFSKIIKDIKDIKDKTIHALLFFITFIQDYIVVRLIQTNNVIGFDE